MSKKIIDENQQIELFNEKLKAHPYYKEGMKIVGVPEGYSGASLRGYTVEGHNSVRRIVAEIEAETKREYEFRLTLRNAS